MFSSIDGGKGEMKWEKQNEKIGRKMPKMALS